jgi:hypothetical protein
VVSSELTYSVKVENKAMALDGDGSNIMLKDPGSPSDDSQNDGKQEKVVAKEQSYAPKSNSSYGTKDYWEERYSKEKDYEWLLSYGYHNIVNIDYSEIVISAMKERHYSERPGMEWRVMDMTDMSELADESFDVVIDKATMDAMMAVEGDVWNPSQVCVDQSRSMCQHVSRILVPGGHFLQISLA